MKFKKRTPPVDFGTPRREEDALFVTEPAAPAHAELSPPLILALDPEALEANVVAPPEQARAKGQLAPTTAPKTPVRHEAASAEALPKLPPAWPVYLVALAVAVLWALGPLAFAVGYRNGVQPLREDTFALVVFAMLAIGPAVFVFGCAYMIRQGQKLAAETRRAHAMAQSMLAPAISAGRAGRRYPAGRARRDRARRRRRGWRPRQHVRPAGRPGRGDPAAGGVRGPFHPLCP